MDKEKIDCLVTVAEDYGFVTLSHDDFLQLVIERDAAISDLEYLTKEGECHICKYLGIPRYCAECNPYNSNFKWRGTKDESV